MRIPVLLLALAGLLPAAPVLARTCAVTIESNDRMQFSLPQITVAADCTQVDLTLKHTGKMAANVMGHNWVLTRTADFQPVATLGMRSTLADSYLPKGDARVIAFTPVIGGGQTARVRFATSKLVRGGDYTFFCSFPGHWGMMKGKLVFA
ncbi:azurin [Stenotrophomonas pictorum JCM 9942]|uniref:Azurin n=1 Tax=Stenotrophomonas pictorum JCM 9942 TaxID=1236960 RepID=A0A0R0AUQ1_9GAMM|nr:azurin [Stenotrophomonas pictorum]KRG44961.1 azurin [Stenotrophomonas pictorum JCM 9942]